MQRSQFFNSIKQPDGMDPLHPQHVQDGTSTSFLLAVFTATALLSLIVSVKFF